MKLPEVLEPGRLVNDLPVLRVAGTSLKESRLMSSGANLARRSYGKAAEGLWQ